MPSINSAELLKDKDIVNEINRYKWCESEKAGCDIGFERASREWINTCSKQYLNQHTKKLAVLWLKSQPIYSILNKEIKTLR
ncbi:MAG: hypothetical protein HQL12_04105 [Candidatus Omnitrophica bacterium]|nr:hypothetical protein [Candidatus Omnitrophota bacterium]